MEVPVLSTYVHYVIFTTLQQNRQDWAQVPSAVNSKWQSHIPTGQVYPASNPCVPCNCTGDHISSHLLRNASPSNIISFCYRLSFFSSFKKPDGILKSSGLSLFQETHQLSTAPSCHPVWSPLHSPLKELPVTGARIQHPCSLPSWLQSGAGSLGDPVAWAWGHGF